MPGDCSNGHGNNSIANKFSFEGKMKDGPISKLIIPEPRHRPTQYKKIVDTLPVLYADKNYQGIDNVIRTGTNLVEMDFMPTYPDADQWSTTHHVEIETVNPNDAPDAVTGSRPPTATMARQTHFLRQISRKSYYPNSSGISNSRHKSFLSLLPTRRL